MAVQTMRALRFDAFAGAAGLRSVDLPKPVAARGEVLVEVRSSAINPSDVKNLAGKMHGTILPRTPGRDFAGVVVEGPSEMIGRRVWGAGGEIGYTRDGAHAEFLVLPEGAACEMPVNLDFRGAAACGVPFVTAWSGVHDVLQLEAGQVLLVTGAFGSVGSAVVQLARWMGVRTIGVVRTLPPADVPAHLRPYHVVMDDRDAMAQAVDTLTEGRGVDAVFDTVGEPLFARALTALRPAGRYVLIANTGAPSVPLELVPFYRSRVSLAGVDSRTTDSVAAAKILERLRAGFDTGALRAPRIDKDVDLDGAIAAYRDIENGAKGKTILNFAPH